MRTRQEGSKTTRRGVSTTSGARKPPDESGGSRSESIPLSPPGRKQKGRVSAVISKYLRRRGMRTRQEGSKTTRRGVSMLSESETTPAKQG
jgi:hypothetical protein